MQKMKINGNVNGHFEIQACFEKDKQKLTK